MTEDGAWRDYTAAFRRDVLPHVLASAYMLSVGATIDAQSIDLRAATEIGLAILLETPLVVIVPKGERVSDALRRAAVTVLEDVDVNDPATQDRIANVFKRLRSDRETSSL